MYYKTQFELTNAILESTIPELDPTDKLILLQLSYHFKRGKDGLFTCFPSYKTLYDKMNIGRTRTIQGMSKLHELGIISSRQQHDSSKIYTWLGLSEIERAHNAEGKTAVTQEEWENYFKNKPTVEALEAEAAAMTERARAARKLILKKGGKDGS